MTRDIKADQEEFELLRSGEQRHLLRLNENFAVGDVLTVREFDTDKACDTPAPPLMFPVLSIESGAEHPAVLSPRFVIMSLGDAIGPAEEGQRGHSRIRGEF